MSNLITIPMTTAQIADNGIRRGEAQTGSEGSWLVRKDGLYFLNANNGRTQWSNSPTLASAFDRKYSAQRIANRFGGEVIENPAVR